MTECQRLNYLFNCDTVAAQAIHILTETLKNNFPSSVKWDHVECMMSEVLNEYISPKYSCDCNVAIVWDDSFVGYDLQVRGAATVLSVDDYDTDIDIDIIISKALYDNDILINPAFCSKLNHVFTLTFIHELTHTTQFDDQSKERLCGNATERYLSSSFEIDAYSMECAYEMFMGDTKLHIESYLLYQPLRNLATFNTFMKLVDLKLAHLKSYK